MSHLVINATELGRQRGGNESFIAGLIEGLAQLKPALRLTLLRCDWGRPVSVPPIFEQVNLGPYRQLPFLLWQQTLALRRLQADWYLANFFLPPLLPCQGAVVVHDLSFRAHPDYFPPFVSLYMKWLTGAGIRQARQVLTVSDFSRQELLRFYPTAPQKVTVIANGVGCQFQPQPSASQPQTEAAILAKYEVTQPYIFAVGNMHPRKNLARLLAAYRRLQAERAALPKMVWGGLPRWESDSLVAQAQAAGVVLPGFIEQADLPTFYRQAEMLVYPSLYEGFGLPPVEAMACGTPVIASNTTSLPEVVGNAALTVDPTQTSEIASAIARLLDDHALSQRLRQAGLDRSQQFTWSRTAQRLLAALGLDSK
ncbi:MAG: glycosyltransferase family 4 protein [Anaerolineae bacterium]|nr:glycosyltransferase family 4 protein [Anaerolineae bacterium]